MKPRDGLDARRHVTRAPRGYPMQPNDGLGARPPPLRLLVRQEKKREANAYGRAMEVFIALLLATGCPAMRVCPTRPRTFIDCVVWAYPSLPELLEHDQFFNPDGTFECAPCRARATW